tara:strand:+ start:65 stop:634 length:570 start_codon:yes stop_codon:yes gene_type:complete
LIKQIKILTAFSILFTIMSCDMNYLDYYQHIESPNGKYNYGLYSGFSIGDPGFLVLKLEKGINPKELKIDYSLKNGISGEDADWMYSREILNNYDEASQYCKDPKIELIDNRFLVFSRGGFMFSLYDIKIEKDTFNNCCPWNEWASQNIWAEKGTDYKGPIPMDEKSDYGIWIKKNIDRKINEYIQSNK